MDISEQDFPLELSGFSHWRKLTDGIEIDFDFEKVKLQFYSPSVLKLHISRGGTFSPKLSSSCIETEIDCLEFSVIEKNQGLEIISALVTAEIKYHPVFQLTIFRTGNDRPFYQSGENFYRYNNDEILIERPYDPTDAIYGLGQKTGPFLRNGQSYKMWNTDILAPDVDGNYVSHEGEANDPLSTSCDPYYMSLPFWCQVEGAAHLSCASFIDNPHRASINFTDQKAQSRIYMKFSGGQYCEYIFAGPTLKEILTEYSRLTGGVMMPPLWSLGYHQCRWHKYSQAEVLELAERHRRDAIPCESLWLDIDHMDEYRVFTWNDKLFPDRELFFKRLKELGYKCVTIIDPGVKYEKGYEVFDNGYGEGYFCKTQSGNVYLGQAWPGHTAFPDFSREDVRKWWGELNAQWMLQGVDGIWNDMNEPATGNISCMSMRFDRDGENAAHDRYHNEYGLLMAQSTYEGLVKKFPDKRPFILSRAGSPGIQRYAANWLGDNASRWEHLRMAVSMSLGLSLSGVPFTGADIGGFVEASEPELFVRWMQYAALTPFCRNHNDHVRDQYAWSFGRSVEKLCRQAIELRYRLLPYLYTQFERSHAYGEPVQRPLVYEYQQDPATRTIDDQYLLGDKLMVAPALEKDQTHKNIYFPKGYWYDWQSGEVLEGESFHTVNAPIGKLPLFVKAGAMITLWPKAASSTASLPQAQMQWHLYLPREDGIYASELYEDDGESFDFYEKQSFLRTKFIIERKGLSVSITTTTEGLGFSNLERQSIQLIFHGGCINSVSKGGQLLELTSAIEVVIDNVGEAVELICELEST